MDVKKKGYSPLALRYLYLTAHYRDSLNFTWPSLESAQNTLDNLRSLVLAANNANQPARTTRLGDLTCDSDGRWPTKDMDKKGKKGVLVPTSDEEQFMVIVATKAYGEQLTGVGGVGHCGLMEPVEFIIEEIDGKAHARIVPRQGYREASALLGYNKSSVKPLRAAAKDKK